jgi:hypothetical protein
VKGLGDAQAILANGVGGFPDEDIRESVEPNQLQANLGDGEAVAHSPKLDVREADRQPIIHLYVLGRYEVPRVVDPDEDLAWVVCIPLKIPSNEAFESIDVFESHVGVARPDVAAAREIEVGHEVCVATIGTPTGTFRLARAAPIADAAGEEHDSLGANMADLLVARDEDRAVLVLFCLFLAHLEDEIEGRRQDKGGMIHAAPCW